MLIQELSNKPSTEPGPCGDNTNTVICTMISELNRRTTKDYGFTITPYAGQEQYVTFYSKKMFNLIKSFPFNFTLSNNDLDTFPRPPQVTYLTMKKSSKSFFLINMHTSPKTTAQELALLPDLVATLIKHDGSIPEGAILGDLNSDKGCGCGFNKTNDWTPILNKMSGWKDFISNSFDTTVAPSANNYDKILMSSGLGAMYASDSSFAYYYGTEANSTIAGNIPFKKIDLTAVKDEKCSGCSANMTNTQAEDFISDHYPIGLRMNEGTWEIPDFITIN
eukprot:TRINITY_DN8632_c0_g2_i1.p1 TRINITY_DN8632_c0_g2~~TRINITY_DN8632_c0_g2_i1.p1  ORF type:complete len:278 (+),score=43.53 TRINITY_DN8632_c0_g2_i1:82-915(+)